MSETIEINCVGMKCPRPVIEIAKAARRTPPGTVLRVVADDLAFESDVQAWCETRGATLVSLEQDGRRYVAVLKLAE